MKNKEGVSRETAEKLLSLQKRCIKCGSTYAMHIHHRVFKSEGHGFLRRFLALAKIMYDASYAPRVLPTWELNDIQNLCVLCIECHEGEGGVGVHGGNHELNRVLKNSFTCPITGFNIPFKK